LENLKANGAKFKTGAVQEWLDCGNKNATVYTNQRVIEHNAADFKTTRNLGEGCQIIEPCYIGDDVTIVNSTVGPHVSVGNGSKITNSKITNSIIMDACQIENATFHNSMIGNHVIWDGEAAELSISDYSTNIATV